MHSPVLCDIYITQIARIEFSFHTSLFLLLVYHTCLTYKVSITLKVFFSFSQSHMPTSNQEIAHHLCAPLFLLAIFALLEMSGLAPSFSTSNAKTSRACRPTVLGSYPEIPIPNSPTLFGVGVWVCVCN